MFIEWETLIYSRSARVEKIFLCVCVCVCVCVREREREREGEEEGEGERGRECVREGESKSMLFLELDGRNGLANGAVS